MTKSSSVTLEHLNTSIFIAIKVLFLSPFAVFGTSDKALCNYRNTTLPLAFKRKGSVFRPPYRAALYKSLQVT